MKSFPIFLLLLSFAFGSAQEINQFDANGQRHGKWMKKYEGTNQIRYRGNFEHGQEIGTFEYFKLLEEKGEEKGEAKKETQKKAAHAFATRTFTPESDLVEVNYFTPKGNVLSFGNMKNRKRVGKWIYYHPDTETIMKVEHYKDGALDGLQITYFENGNVAKEAYFKNEKMDGITKIYAKNGTLLKYFTYQNGVLDGVTKYFDSAGNLTAKGMYKNNRKDGVWKTYENGKVVKTVEYPIH